MAGRGRAIGAFMVGKAGPGFDPWYCSFRFREITLSYLVILVIRTLFIQSEKEEEEFLKSSAA